MLKQIENIKEQFLASGKSETEWNDFIIDNSEELLVYVFGGDDQLLYYALNAFAKTEIIPTECNLVEDVRFYLDEDLEVKTIKKRLKGEKLEESIKAIVQEVQKDKPVQYLENPTKKPFFICNYAGIPFTVEYRRNKVFIQTTYTKHKATSNV